MPKVLVTRRQFEDQMDRLRSEAETVVLTRPAPAPPQELRQAARGASAILAHVTDQIDAAVMDAAGDSLKLIAEFVVGYDNVDTAAASQRNIAVANTPGVLAETTAEFAFALVQASARRLAESDRFVRRGEWKWFDPLGLLGIDIHGSTLGIVGMGRIGSAVATRALACGMRVIYYNRTRADDEHGAQRVGSLNELLAQSDFVTLHSPLTPETKGLIGARQLRTMRSHAALINTARGPIVDTAALTDALRSGEIAYAALDVTDPEPLPTDHPLLSMENVTLLPHMASATVGTRRKMTAMNVDDILAALRGEPPPNCVNADQIDWS